MAWAKKGNERKIHKTWAKGTLRYLGTTTFYKSSPAFWEDRDDKGNLVPVDDNTRNRLCTFQFKTAEGKEFALSPSKVGVFVSSILEAQTDPRGKQTVEWLGGMSGSSAAASTPIDTPTLDDGFPDELDASFTPNK